MYTPLFSFLRAKIAVLLVTLVGSVILSSCNHDDSALLSTKEETDKRPLKFNVNFLGSWQVENSAKSAISRGTATNTLSDAIYDSFGVFASYYDTGEEYTQTQNYMYDTESGEYMDGWQTFTPFAMPPINKEMSFCSYYPYQSDEAPQPYITFNGGNRDYVGHPYFDFIIPDSVQLQPDLMVATSNMSSTDLATGSPIPLKFTHMLTAIKFVFDASIPRGYILKISINNVSKGGSFVYGRIKDGTVNDPDYSWSSVSAETKNFTLNTRLRTGTGLPVPLADDQTFLMMPQHLDQDASVTIVYDNGSRFEFTTSLAERTWEPGKIITYNVKINSLKTISLKATIEDWIVGDTYNWTSSY